MVKIRLRRMGNKHRPFYRIVVARSTAARDGSFIEQIGTYNPVAQPKQIELKGDRALHWLLEGAQPTETVAVIMKGQGVLEEYFEKRPKARASYKFLDKRTSAMTRKSAVTEVPAAPKAEDKPEATVAEAPTAVAVAEAPPAETPVADAPIAEVPAAEVSAADAPVETPEDAAPAVEPPAKDAPEAAKEEGS